MFTGSVIEELMASVEIAEVRSQEPRSRKTSAKAHSAFTYEFSFGEEAVEVA